MKLTTEQLKKIIKEELESIMGENVDAALDKLQGAVLDLAKMMKSKNLEVPSDFDLSAPLDAAKVMNDTLRSQANKLDDAAKREIQPAYKAMLDAKKAYDKASRG